MPANEGLVDTLLSNRAQLAEVAVVGLFHDAFGSPPTVAPQG
jgi:hypothetical protein